MSDEENKDIQEKSLALVEDPIIQSLVKSCDAELVGNIHLTNKEISELKKYAILIKYGDHNMIPMICTGERCIVKLRCPLVKFKKPILGKECPFERYALNQWKEDYVQSLDVDINDKIERQQILDLVEADILNARANVVLGDEGFWIDNPVGTDETTGEAITRREEHIALKLKDRVQKRKDKILKSFLATREAKLKALQSAVKDPTEYLAELRAKAALAAEKHDKTIDAEIVEDVKKDGEKKDEQRKSDKKN